ncbi:MAG: hypothetical protein JO332_01410 [Planctomycetaceae bacterium]|nr:hypothetical protein [Planctomycetaceae bacterium]
MFHPVLTLLVAGSIHAGADFKAPRDVAQIVLELTEALPGSVTPLLVAEAAPTVVDVPYYYSDFTPVAVRETAPVITYDWRSPVFRDVP